MAYEMVIGLETHVELKTETKIFCGCPTAYGAEPNTQCCPVCMGLPGALPVLNAKVVQYAIRAGLALSCDIAPVTRLDRKNYFYPDLPKAYQISQLAQPLCEHGHVDIDVGAEEKSIRITRIHIEEDAGKLVHDAAHGTLIDLNRCGVPLIEIVTEPDIRSADEARAYLQKLRETLLFTGISDLRMNEGSMRCDVNLSVRKMGDSTFGTRTEIKNMNSFQAIARAIESEFARQVELLESGGQVVQETRRFDAKTGQTYAMRSKEDFNDYRYFPEPDLPPVYIAKEQIEAKRSVLKELEKAVADQAAAGQPISDPSVQRITSAQKTMTYEISDPQEVATYAQRILTQNEGLAQKYRAGKTQAMQALMGQAMRGAQGKMDPAMLNKALETLLN